MASIACLVLAIGAMNPGPVQDSNSGNDEQNKRLIASALQNSASKGGIVLKGRREKKMQGTIELEVAGSQPAPEILGDFTLRVGKNGVIHAAFESEKMQFESFSKDEKGVHRLSWAGGAAPNTDYIGLELRRMMRWGELQKYTAKATETRSGADSVVEGAACREISCSLPVELLKPEAAKPKKEKEEEESSGDLAVAEVRAMFRIGKGDDLIKQLEIVVTRQVEGMGDKIEFVSRYILTVEKYDSDLTVRMPAELNKLLE